METDCTQQQGAMISCVSWWKRRSCASVRGIFSSSSGLVCSLGLCGVVVCVCVGRGRCWGAIPCGWGGVFVVIGVVACFVGREGDGGVGGGKGARRNQRGAGAGRLVGACAAAKEAWRKKKSRGRKKESFFKGSTLRCFGDHRDGRRACWRKDGLSRRLYRGRGGFLGWGGCALGGW
jgi:hypothetical protein